MVEVAFTMTRFVTVEVALFTRSAAFTVCWAVQVFAFPVFRFATTAPEVGEMVSEESDEETEVTPPKGRQVPSTAKQPSVRFTPFANVEEAEVEVRFRMVALTPPPKEEVAVPETVSAVVEAWVVTARYEVVASVVPIFVRPRRVPVATFAKIFPEM